MKCIIGEQFLHYILTLPLKRLLIQIAGAGFAVMNCSAKSNRWSNILNVVITYEMWPMQKQKSNVSLILESFLMQLSTSARNNVILHFVP